MKQYDRGTGNANYQHESATSWNTERESRIAARGCCYMRIEFFFTSANKTTTGTCTKRDEWKDEEAKTHPRCQKYDVKIH